MRTTNVITRKRLTGLFLLAVLAMAGLIIRLAWIQFVSGEKWQKKAEEMRMRDIPVEAARGNMYDRNGKLLVSSVNVPSLYTIPYLVKDPRSEAAQLAPLLKRDPERLYSILSRKSCFEWLDRKMDAAVAKQIKQLNLPGIFIVEESKRYYPFPTLASHLLGFTGIDNQGLMGLEKTYDRELQGTPGRIMVEQDASGREIADPLERYVPPRQGNGLILTLDKTIQQIVERELDLVVAKYQPKLAVIIVMDPKTGEILAMGNRPTFNTNDWMDSPREVWDRNPAIWYNYEPGSTFKIITTSAAMAEGVVKPSDQFFDPGYIKVADRYIRCWADGGHGSETFTQVVMNSCNPGFVEVGLRLGVPRFYRYVKEFGFGQPTGIDLPGEATGITIPEKKATNLNLATMAIGQSIAVTPIQLISAAAAVANGGTLLQPHLVKEIRSPEGKVIKTFTSEAQARVLSPQTALQVRELLEKVVAEGTGRNAFVEGYRVAGKTGTAQVVGAGGGYVSGRYVASFVGFAPVDNPRLAALVMVAEPQGGVYYGSQVAAPVFSAVARDVLHYLQVPDDPSIKKPPSPFVYEEPKVKVNVPNVVNMPLEVGQKMLREAGLAFRVEGEGPLIYGQTPMPGAEVMSGTTVLLNMKPPAAANGQVTVPNLNGLTLSEAADLLKNMDLYLKADGLGVAAEQQPVPGTRVKSGTTIRVQFRPASEKAPPAMAKPGWGFVERP